MYSFQRQSGSAFEKEPSELIARQKHNQQVLQQWKRSQEEDEEANQPRGSQRRKQHEVTQASSVGWV